MQKHNNFLIIKNQFNEKKYLLFDVVKTTSLL